MSTLKTISGLVVGLVAMCLYGCYVYPDSLSSVRIIPNDIKQFLSNRQPVFPNYLQSGWTPPTLPDHLQGADQKDPELIKHIREHWILPPFTGTRNLPPGKVDPARRNQDYSQHGVPTVIDRILHERRGGFLVECGAADGLITSNSLWLELYRNWTGILIEANPSMFLELLELKRHMYMLNACLSPTTKPQLLAFSLSGIGGGISDYLPHHSKHNASRVRRHSRDHTVQCFPIYSVLAALDVVHVDFFSLDVEGAEIPILKTIPFDDITIDSISIEKREGDTNSTERKTGAIVNVLSKSGFEVAGYNTLDVILVRLGQNSSLSQ